MLDFLKKLFKSKTGLEMYISSKQPKNTYDIDKYTRDYYDKVNQGFIVS
jgi:hypothetical protein